MAFFPRKLIAAAMLAALSLPSLAQMPAPQPGAAPAPMAAPHHVVRKKAQHVKRNAVRHHRAHRAHRAHRRAHHRVTR